MEKNLLHALDVINSYVWGLPTIVLLVGVGIFYTIKLKGIQLYALPHALYLAFIKRREKGGDASGDISHFQALMTALSATVGTGNIAGVATAIASGGPGALFWMWVTGLFGMATKYSEAVLAVKFREVDKNGEMSGGPMYYLWKGLKLKSLGVLFAIFASISAFGIGNMVQSNSVADAVYRVFNVPFWITGVVLFVFTSLVIIGGIKNIAKVTGFFVPFMIIFYFVGALLVIILNIEKLPEAFSLIFKTAFTGHAAVGGFLGATVKKTVQMGVARGIFSNESGLGSSPIAAAAAKTKDPTTQALVSMTQTFIDTIIICTMTGIVIIMSGAWTTGATGASLTTKAFNTLIPHNVGGYIVAIGLIFFAYSTILGWGYYGEKSILFLFGEKSIPFYRLLFVIMVFVGAVSKLELVWKFADMMNGLMALPNLIGLLGLSSVVALETKRYFSKNKID